MNIYSVVLIRVTFWFIASSHRSKITAVLLDAMFPLIMASSIGNLPPVDTVTLPKTVTPKVRLQVLFFATFTLP